MLDDIDFRAVKTNEGWLIQYRKKIDGEWTEWLLIRKEEV